MLGRLRFGLWRHQVLLAAVYLTFLSLTASAFLLYHFLVPANADVGLTLALRALAYRRTFHEVEAARGDIAHGKLADAEARLARFLADHSRVQSARLDSHAVTDARCLLADVHMRQGRSGPAADVLEEMVRIEPLDYLPWFRLGQIYESRGDPPQAARCLREAFKLAPNHPGVTETYLSVLAQQYAFEEGAWVADEFERASRRGLPMVQIKAGGPRSSLERHVLSFAGVPVEHGDYGPVKEVFGLPRGARRTLSVPAEMLALASPGKPLYVQLRFENVYDGLTVDALRYRTPGGRDAEVVLSPEKVSELHQSHSAAAWYLEIRTELRPREIADLEVVYSCPDDVLSKDALRFVATCRAQVATRSDP